MGSRPLFPNNESLLANVPELFEHLAKVIVHLGHTSLTEFYGLLLNRIDMAK